jgi:hypothetical protein
MSNKAMSRKQKNNSNKSKNKPAMNMQRTPLTSHQKQGSLLVPPMATLPNMALASWRNDRLPEMLWAALVVTGLEREEALDLFRHVADYGRKFRDEADESKNGSKPKYLSQITHTGIAELDEESRSDILAIIADYPSAKEVLRPLLLLNDLPAREDWHMALGSVDPHPNDWDVLMMAVARTLDHQSQEATDCRWLRVLFQILTGRIIFVGNTSETGMKILHYPNRGDMHKVRPSIRAAEGVLDALGENESLGKDLRWAEAFWAQCLADTHCLEASEKISEKSLTLGTTAAHLNEVYEQVVQHAYAARQTSAVDAKHDTVFGTVLYCLSIVRESLGIGVSQAIIGRLALRTVVESHITLAYLVAKEDPELWKSYRVYGAGQAKLALLHVERFEDRPEYVNAETLEHLADEDIWSEYLSINIGHWEKSNLRAMSEAAGVKDIYDQYYPWPSTYLHSHWGAVRDAVFQTCYNPLHRLHRIPRQHRRLLDDVLPDLCVLADKSLELLNKCYPGFVDRVTVPTRD